MPEESGRDIVLGVMLLGTSSGCLGTLEMRLWSAGGKRCIGYGEDDPRSGGGVEVMVPVEMFGYCACRSRSGGGVEVMVPVETMAGLMGAGSYTDCVT